MCEYLFKSALVQGIAITAMTPAFAPMTAMQFQPTQGIVVARSVPNATANDGNAVFDRRSTFRGQSTTFNWTGPTPPPGIVVIRPNGKVEVDMNAFSTPTDNGANSTSAGGTFSGFKVNPIAFGTVMRLYPGVDGMSTGGLRYGAAVEFRENVGGPPGLSAIMPTTAGGIQPPGLSGGTRAAGSAVAKARISREYSPTGTIFFRRMFAYLGADDDGIVRRGQADGLIDLFDPCISSAQCWDAGVGDLNAGGIQIAALGNSVLISFPGVAQSSAEYRNAIAVYRSPQIFGIDFGVRYPPGADNSFSLFTGATAASPSPCAQPGPNCVATTTGEDGTHWYYQFAVDARWQGNYGPLESALMAVWETAGEESVFGPAIMSGGAGKVLGNANENLNFVDSASYAALSTGIGKFMYSIDWIDGALKDQVAMRPTDGTPENVTLTGLMWNNGALTRASEVGPTFSQGAPQLTDITLRREFEVAMAPGLYLVAE